VSERLHDDEPDTGVDVVRALLEGQVPQLADLPLALLSNTGTDNAIYRLGNDLAVRLPRIHWALDTVAKEQRWIPVLAPLLPLDVPRPVAAGTPEPAFPHAWGVVEWLPGEHATLDRLDDPVRAALDLATFVQALRAIDTTGGPEHRRGGPVRTQDAWVRAGVEGLRGEVDGRALLKAWERVCEAPDHDGPPVWFHGDLSYLNLLAREGRLSAVIDWGTCGVGDPAIETIVAWCLFPPEARRAYREALDVDDATWERGRGWVLTGVVGIPYYRETNPVLVADKIRGIEAVLAH
jgi:aminoglycoside phosphotransferase (APT) family kinase protein